MCLFNALANERVPLQIKNGQAWICLVPDIGRELMPPQHILVRLFILGAIQHQPIRPGITYSVAEHQIESPSYLVDEIVHVAIQAAVIVAGENHALLVVHEHPASRMDGGNPRQMATNENVARGVLHQPQQVAHQPAAQQTGLDATDYRELVGNVVVFQIAQLGFFARRNSRRVLLIGLLPAAELVDEDGGIKNQEWSKHQQNDGHADEVNKISYPPAERGPFWPVKLDAAAVNFRRHKLPQSLMDLLRRHLAERFLVLLNVLLQVQAKGILLPNLNYRSSAPIHVHGGGGTFVLFHPAGKVGAGCEILAEGENAL